MMIYKSLLLLSAFVSSAVTDVRLPPSIIQHPVDSAIYKVGGEIELQCVARGAPSPQYKWTKNGRPYDSYTDNVRDGTIRVKFLSIQDEGHYQCHASNDYGTALSSVAVLRMVQLSNHDPKLDVFDSPPIQEGKPYKLECHPASCFPKATISWALAKSEIDVSPIPLRVNERMQIDENGDLHFAYVRREDYQNGSLYKCNMYNPYIDHTIGVSNSRLNVKYETGGSAKPIFREPNFGFASPARVIALEGRDVSIRCFYTGKEAPTINWAKNGGSLYMSRYRITNYNTELTILNVHKSDEGLYNCTARNHLTAPVYSIQIDVQAAPVFKNPKSDSPHNVNITEGDSVTINCNAYAVPTANIVWMRNGLKLDPHNLPAKYSLSADSTRLHISNLCKSCPEAATDLAVIQCNASNEHGYAYSEGYINVLQRTQLTQEPEDVYGTHDQTLSTTLSCDGTTDASTPLTVRWYKVHSVNSTGGAGDELLHNTTNVIIGSDGRSLTITLPGNTSDWRRHRGGYKCILGNGYSSDEAMATLNIYGPEPDILPTESPLPDMWWVFLLAALLLLFLILLICCCFRRRNKGDSYLVDKEERKCRINPIEELEADAFQEYRRPDREPFIGGGASLNSSIDLGSEDAASLNQYGDIDTGNFTEDGSFIGTYRPTTAQRSQNNHHV